MFRKLVLSVVISLSIATTYVLWRGTPTAPEPDVAPSEIQSDQPAVVTVTVRIQDAAFNVYSVDLVRVDAQAAVLSEIDMTDEDGTNTDAIAGHRFFLRMRDDGEKGDAVPGDRVFTRRVTLKESSGPVYFEVRASFTKVERPVRSSPFVVNVRQ